jgi:hypothetical protein
LFLSSPLMLSFLTCSTSITSGRHSYMTNIFIFIFLNEYQELVAMLSLML